MLVLSLQYKGQQWDWAKSLGHQWNDIGQFIGLDNNENLYVTGYKSYYSCAQCGNYYYQQLYKFNKNGKLLWQDTIPAVSVAVTDADGNTYMLSGGTILKYDNQGILTWSISDPQVAIFSIAINPTGGFATAGRTFISGLETGIISSYKPDGTKNWDYSSNQDHTANGMVPNAIACDAIGNIYYSGGANFADTTGLLSKFDVNGKHIFSLTVPLSPENISVSQNGEIYLIKRGGPFVLNNVSYPDDYTNHFIKFDNTGNLTWVKDYKSQDANILKTSVVDKNNNVYLLANWLHSMDADGITLNSPSPSLVVFKYDPNGKKKWHINNNTSTMKGSLSPYAMILGSNNDLILTGSATGTVSFDNSTISSNDLYPDLLLAKIGNTDNAVSISEMFKNEAGLLIYPNPSGAVFNVEYLNANEGDKITLKVINLLGSAIYREVVSGVKGKYTKIIDLSGLSKGTYFVSLQNRESITTRKIIVQ